MQVRLKNPRPRNTGAHMDHKTAGLMLYALQTASVNLRNVQFEVEEVTDVVIDRDTVNATSINGPQWFEEDFDEEEEDQDEVQSETDGEDTAGGVQVTAESGAKAGAKDAVDVKRISPQETRMLEEARMKVRGVVRDWVLEKVGETPQ